MQNITQELDIQHKTPEAYKSGISFFYPKFQKEFATMEYDEIKFLFLAKPKEKARYVHELWRTGRLDVVYQYFTDHERLMRESIVIVAPDGEYSIDELTIDDVAFNTAILLKKGASSEECVAFINDVLCVGSNAHDDQQYGEQPVDLDRIAAVTDTIWTMTSEYYKGMENL